MMISNHENKLATGTRQTKETGTKYRKIRTYKLRLTGTKTHTECDKCVLPPKPLA